MYNNNKAIKLNIKRLITIFSRIFYNNFKPIWQRNRNPFIVIIFLIIETSISAETSNFIIKFIRILV